MTDLTDLCKRIYDVSPGYRDDADWSPAVAVLREALTEGVDHDDVYTVRRRILFEEVDFATKYVEDAFDRILAAKSAAKPGDEDGRRCSFCGAIITRIGHCHHSSECVDMAETHPLCADNPVDVKPAVEPSKVDVHCTMDWENKTADITVNGKTTHLTEVVEPSEIAMEVVARLRAQHEGPGYLFVLHDDEAAAIIQRAIDDAVAKDREGRE